MRMLLAAGVRVRVRADWPIGRLANFESDFGLDYSIKDAGFELFIEVGVKGLDDVFVGCT